MGSSNWEGGSGAPPAEPDLSWMSFSPEAHGIKPALSVWTTRNYYSSSLDELQQQQQLREQEKLKLQQQERLREENGGSRGNGFWGRGKSRSPVDERERSGSKYRWREEEIVEEDEEGELLRRRRRGRQEQARKVAEDYGYDDGDDDGEGASFSSSSLAVGIKRPNSFSARPLGRGFDSRGQNKSQMQEGLDEDGVSPAQLSESSKSPSLQIGVTVAFAGCFVVLGIAIFLFYLSFGVTPRPPSSCEVDKLVLRFTARRIRLRGGRYISFREQGVGADSAKHSLLVVHDLLSSRLAGIPGISDSLLKEYGVRLIAYDRPGYGQSDPHPGRSYNSSAQDMADIADALGVVGKFWVAGFGSGGPHVWASIKYIPDRLAGVTLFAPAGSYSAENMTMDEVAGTWGVLNLRQKWMYSIARLFPALLPSLLQKTLVDHCPSPLWTLGGHTVGSKEETLGTYSPSSWPGEGPLPGAYSPLAWPAKRVLCFCLDWIFCEDCTITCLEASLCDPKVLSRAVHIEDRILMENDEILNFWNQDVREALQQQCAFPVAEELILLVNNWGFSLDKLAFNQRQGKTSFLQVFGLFQAKEEPKMFSGPIHIWQGTDDKHVPATVNEYAKRMVLLNDFSKIADSPVNLHILEGEGHFSSFWFCDDCHRTIFKSLFKPEAAVSGPKGPQVFSPEEYEAIVAAFGGAKEIVSKLRKSEEAPAPTRNVEEAATDLLYRNSEETTPTGIKLYVPESCDIPIDLSTFIIRAIDERIRKYIR